MKIVHVNLKRKSNPDITKWMQIHNISSYAQLEQVYVQQVIDISDNIGYSYIVWQEVIDNGVKVCGFSLERWCFARCKEEIV